MPITIQVVAEVEVAASADNGASGGKVDNNMNGNDEDNSKAEEAAAERSSLPEPLYFR